MMYSSFCCRLVDPKMAAAYDGGADSATNGAMFEQKVDASNWTVLLETAVACTTVAAKHGAAGLDAIALNGLSLHNWAVSNKHPMAKVMEATWAGPLSWIFDAPILAKSGALAKWHQEGPRQYDNAAEFKAISDSVNSKAYYDAREAERTKILQQLKYDNVLQSVEQMHTSLSGRLGLGKAEFDLFGGQAGFVDWWHAKNQFCYFQTIPYINAIVNRNVADIEKIFLTYTRYCKKGLEQGQYKTALLFTDATVAANFDRAKIYCTMLQFICNTLCCGGGGMEALAANAANDANPIPNQAIPTSYARLICQYYRGK